MARKGLKPLYIYIPIHSHKQLKQAALDNEISMKQLVERLIQAYLLVHTKE